VPTAKGCLFGRAWGGAGITGGGTGKQLPSVSECKNAAVGAVRSIFCLITLDELHGRGKHRVDYRHIIDWLVRKPGAFENYRFPRPAVPSPFGPRDL